MKVWITDLAVNLRHGLRAMLLARVSLDHFRVTADQFVALVFLLIAAQWAVDMGFNGWRGYLNIQALTAQMAVIMALLLAAFVAAKLTMEPRIVLAYPVALLAMDLFFTALQGALRWGGPRLEWLPVRGLYVALLAWFLVAACVLLIRLAPGRPRRAIAGFAVYLLLFFASYWKLPAQDLWMASPAEAESAERQVSVADEAIFHAQPALLAGSLAALRPERPGVTDIYFVGFGAYAPEDVFMKEVETIGELFRERFDAEGRTVALINNQKTAGSVAIATATNLAHVLRHVGGLMNREEDILVLYLTSHGSEQHRLAVVNWPLVLLEIDPRMLRRMLDDAGIKWRVLAVSACYAGGFVEPLRSDTTLIMTAADAKSTSFGCGSESDFTYFGKALFDEELRNTHSFTKAFEAARQSIAERERSGRHEASSPQIYVGASMPGKLREMESRLEALAARSRAVEEEK